MTTGMKVFLACAIGAFIGSMVALELNPYFWWLGLIVGGFAGYISYEFKAVMNAVPKAWGIVRKKIREDISETRISRPIKILAYIIFGYLFFLALGVCFCANFFFLHTLLTPKTNFWFYMKKLSAESGIFLSLPFFSFSFTLLTCMFIDNLEGGKSNKQIIVAALFPTVMPLIFTLFIVIYIMYKKGSLVISFTKHLFLLIHSDIRLLCGIDAAIGTGIGYLAGNAIVGMLAGGVFGLINYELVSKRLLKLQPKNI